MNRYQQISFTNRPRWAVSDKDLQRDILTNKYNSQILTTPADATNVASANTYPRRNSDDTLETFSEGFKQSMQKTDDKWSYNRGRIQKWFYDEEEKRRELQSIQELNFNRENPRFIEYTINDLYKENENLLSGRKLQDLTPSEREIFEHRLDQVHGLHEYRKQLLRYGTSDLADQWTNEYIEKGGDGSRRMQRAIDNQKNYKQTSGWGTIGEVSGDIAQSIPEAAITVVSPGVGAGLALARDYYENSAESNMVADQIEQENQEEISPKIREGNAIVNTGINFSADFIPIKGVDRLLKPLLKMPYGKNIIEGTKESIKEGVKSGGNDLSNNSFYNTEISPKEIIDNAIKSSVEGFITGGIKQGLIENKQKMYNTPANPFRPIP
ncbi:MAG: hypothetical protein IJY36_01740 [Coprobacter sp.]|nr:hypothetical protein [Coprobacter sp.]